MSEFLVNKIGGTSAGSPEAVKHLVDNPEGTLIPAEHEGEARLVMVVSAIGQEDGDKEGKTRITNMTRAYYDSVASGNPSDQLRDDIVARHEHVYDSLGSTVLTPILDELYKSLKPDPDKTEADYVSLGEEYSGRLMAEAIGGVYMDPRHVEFNGGGYKLGFTVTNLKQAKNSSEFHAGRPIVYAGFYGYNAHGRRQLLDSGGSDRTMAALAIGLDSKFCTKWSDIKGIHTAHPSIVKDTLIRPEFTPAEIREYSLGGNPVLNGRTPVDFDQFNWDGSLVIRSTFEPNKQGTKIIKSREIDTENPVAAIASRNVDMISINDFGMAHEVGYVWRAAGRAEELGLSISHLPASNDALTFVIDPDQDNVNGEYAAKLAALEGFLKEEALSPNVKARVEQDRALLVLVGEGLRDEKTRTLSTARLSLALLRDGIAVRDNLGNIQSPSLIFEVDRNEADRCQQIAHKEFITDPMLHGLVSIPNKILRQYKK